MDDGLANYGANLSGTQCKHPKRMQSSSKIALKNTKTQSITFGVISVYVHPIRVKTAYLAQYPRNHIDPKIENKAHYSPKTKSMSILEYRSSPASSSVLQHV